MSETPHLDAERLAALMDGTLSRVEREVAERHAADCGDCLQLLAAMTRTEPLPVRTGWHLPAMVRWAVPLAAAATAVALWVNAERRAMGPPPATVAGRSAEAPATGPDAAAAPPVATAPAESAPDAKAPAPAREADGKLMTDAAPRPGRPGREEERKQLVSQNRVRELSEQAKANDEPPTQAGSRPAAPIPIAAVPPSPTSRLPAAESPPPSGVPQLPAAVSDARAEFSTVRRADVDGFEVASPEPLVRWRVRGTTVARSTDGGKTWSDAIVAFPAAIRAGTSPAPHVAWVVGQQGLVMRTIDGLTWTRGGSPGPFDLTGVRAQNALEADVTAADGRVFRTTDGGRSWTPQESAPSPF